jgi:hypothetical protein
MGAASLVFSAHSAVIWLHGFGAPPMGLIGRAGGWLEQHGIGCVLGLVLGAVWGAGGVGDRRRLAVNGMAAGGLVGLTLGWQALLSAGTMLGIVCVGGWIAARGNIGRNRITLLGFWFAVAVVQIMGWRFWATVTSDAANEPAVWFLVGGLPVAFVLPALCRRGIEREECVRPVHAAAGKGPVGDAASQPIESGRGEGEAPMHASVAGPDSQARMSMPGVKSALWVPGWFERDQSIEVGQSDMFWFFVDPPLELAALQPADLVFYYQSASAPRQARRATVAAIDHITLGPIQKVDTAGLDYRFRLAGGDELVVNAEERPGSTAAGAPAVRDWTLRVTLTDVSEPLSEPA